MSGVDHMIYMYSINASNGKMTLRVSFEVGTDPNTDQILSQMRYSQAEAKLPQEVRSYGVKIRKSTTSPLALFSLYWGEGLKGGVSVVGAERVLACFSHALLSGPAMERLRSVNLERAVVTDTIPLSEEKARDPKITVLSVANLLGEAIARIHSNSSVSSLFV